MGKQPNEVMESIRGRFRKIAVDLLRHKRRADILRNQVKGLRAEVARLTDEIDRVRPTATTWGWLAWTLGRDEVISVTIKSAKADTKEQVRIRCALYQNGWTAWKRFAVNNLGNGIYRITKKEITEFEYTKKTAQSYMRDRKGRTKEIFGKYAGIYAMRVSADQCVETLTEALAKAETLLVRRMQVKQAEVNDLNSSLGQLRSMILRGADTEGSR